MIAQQAAGPFQTGSQAREVPAVRAAYDAARASARRGVLAEHGRGILDEALGAAGVSLGAYDDEIMTWLAGIGPECCAVLAGIITRAAAGGGR